MAATVTQNGGVLAQPNGQLAMHVYCSTAVQIAINTVAYTYSKTAGTTMNYGEVAEAFCNTIKSLYTPIIANPSSFLGVKASPLNEPTKPLSGIAIDPTSGAGGATMMPTQSTGLLTWLTNIAGPAGRGRIYVPFPPAELADTNGSPSAAYLTALTNLAVGFLTFNAVVGANATYSFIPVLWQRSSNSATVILSERRNDKWATQKKRGSYGRINTAVIT